MNKSNVFFKKLIRDKGLLILALPAVLYLIIFNYIPLYGLLLPFKEFKISNGGFWGSFLGSPWVGLDNFRFLLSADDIGKILFRTIGYNFIFIFGGTFLSVIVALLLFELSRKATRVYQTVMFFPFFLSWAVAAYVFMALLDIDYGVLNKILAMFGIAKVFWYNEPNLWPFILIIVSFWKGLGYGSVIYYAGLMNISPEYYEAAKIDGATKLQQITKISVPLLKPLVVMMILLALGRIFYSDFGLFYSVPLNNPQLYSATEVFDTYVYKLLTSMGDINLSAAANFIQSIMGFVLVLLSNWLVNKYNSELSIL